MINTKHAIKSHYINSFWGKKAESWKQISLESNSNFKQQKAKQRDLCGIIAMFSGKACAQLNHKTEGNPQEVMSCLSYFTAGWMLFRTVFNYRGAVARAVEFKFYETYGWKSSRPLVIIVV